jgi:hypothetical protein
MTTRIRRARRKVWANLALISLILFVLASAYFYYSLQRSRLESCKANYEAFNKVFKPLLPPRAKQTPKQRHDIDKLHATVTDLKNKCNSQISTKGLP